MNSTDIIAELLTAYLRFPVSDLFLPDTDPIIFGGCIRDSLAGDGFTDIDVVGYSQTLDELGESLKLKGFKYEQPTISDYNEMPEFNLHRFTNPKLPISIDIIKPRIRDFNNNPTNLDPADIKEVMLKFIKNVDIRACGVGYSLKGGIMELIPGAINDCLTKQIVVLPDGILHRQDRNQKRVTKLLSRGWNNNKPEVPEKKNLDIRGYNF